MQETVSRLKPGDILAFETQKGARYAQVTHLRAPYPDVLRVLNPVQGTASAEELAKGETAFVAMVELGKAMQDDTARPRVIGSAAIPQAHKDFPTFRLPIRNKAGEIVYWWMWDGDGLSVAPDDVDMVLPIREVMPVSVLMERLAAL